MLFNCICVAMVGPLIFAFLGRHLPPKAIAAALAVALFFGWTYLLPYTFTAYSDNLYLVTMFATLLGAIAALEAPRTWRFFACGVLIALAAATRPSGFIFLPLFAVAVLMSKEIGSLAARVKAIVATIAGFAAAVSPFTVRNRIVTGRWVMLVGGYMSITAFLYPPEGNVRQIPLLVDGHMPTILQTLGQIKLVIMDDPARAAWVEMRKILFTLGWTSYGPAGLDAPFFGLYPILFAAALFARRIPRATAYVLLAFLASHLASMVLGAPWTYGYKSILPFHLACLIGAAFLLKPLGARPGNDPASEHE
jgi:4-amino-4-deoxy-L-arabinose transferase-like glycosyltransferase